MHPIPRRRGTWPLLMRLLSLTARLAAGARATAASLRQAIAGYLRAMRRTRAWIIRKQGAPAAGRTARSTYRDLRRSSPDK